MHPVRLLGRAATGKRRGQNDCSLSFAFYQPLDLVELGRVIRALWRGPIVELLVSVEQIGRLFQTKGHMSGKPVRVTVRASVDRGLAQPNRHLCGRVGVYRFSGHVSTPSSSFPCFGAQS